MGCPKDFDHYDPSIADDPYPVLKQMREECPVARSEKHGGFWAVTSYDTVYQVAHDHDTFSSARGRITIPSPDLPVYADSGQRALPIELDPPEHRKYRSIVNPFFSPAQATAMEPRIRELATELIDAFIERGQADLAQEFAFPMPMFVICQILGIPSDRWKEFRDWITRLVRMGEDPQDALAAGLQVSSYIASVLEERRANPGDDLVSYLISAEVDGERMNEIELLGFCTLLFGAGAETTTNAIANSLLYLGRHPEVRSRLIQDPSLIPSAVEEFLRYDTPVFGLARTVTRDVELHGEKLGEGDRVLILWGAANHDEAEFLDGEEVVIDRFPNRHMAFGSGIHRCLGSHLARTEIRIALEEVLRRVPDYEIRDDAEVERFAGVTRGVKTLPVRFGRQRQLAGQTSQAT